MTTEVTMPRLSETMVDGKILSWNKKPGDRVNKGDILAEVETDKANMEIEAIDSGILSEILVEEGQLAKVGAPIAVLDGKAKPSIQPPTEKIDTEQAKRVQERKATEIQQEKPTEEEILEQPKKQKIEPAQFQYKEKREAKEEEIEGKKVEEIESKPSGISQPEFIKASPIARKLAKEKGINLADIKGTGPGGRITEEDVESFSKPKEVSPEKKEKPEQKGVKIIELSRMRKTIATRLTQSKQQIPHFYVTYEVNADKLVDFHNSLKSQDKENITFNDIFVKALSIALVKNQKFNAHFIDDHIEVFDSVNIGIAFAQDEGLLVPVVHDCQNKSLSEISQATRGLKDRFKANKLKPEDLSGGTISVSNMGMFGVKVFQAIINPPEIAGIAIGAIIKQPVIMDNNIIAGNILNVTISADHRAVDGVEAAIFLNDFKNILENPDQISI